MKQEIPNIEVGFKKTSYGKRELMPAMIQRAAGTKLKNQLLNFILKVLEKELKI